MSVEIGITGEFWFLQELHLLDAGCGTVNFTKALIDYGVGKVTLLDASAGMLDRAKDKLKDAMDKNIIDKVVEAKMPPLPFEDGSFDAILFSLVRYVMALPAYLLTTTPQLIRTPQTRFSHHGKTSFCGVAINEYLWENLVCGVKINNAHISLPT